MNRLSCLTFLSLLVIYPLNGFSICEQYYEDEIIDIKVSLPEIAGGAIASTIGGLLVEPVFTTGAGVASSMVSLVVLMNDYKFVLHIISEAKVGRGLNINKFCDNVVKGITDNSYHSGLSCEEISRVLLSLNNENSYCLDPNSLMNTDEIKQLIIKEFLTTRVINNK